MFNPVSTYRFQFHKDFTFEHFERIIPYVVQLGVKTIYASPIFEAVPGSMHGYDGVNPHRINPEIGTEEQLRSISSKLKEAGIGWLQDIVPNHMAFHPSNAWLMDVLEKGKQSAYAHFFDIGWESDIYDGRLMVPFLGAPLEEVILKGELKLANDNGRPMLQYFDAKYPMNERSRSTLFQHCNEQDIQACIDKANNDKTLVLRIAEEQHYRMCKWDETDKRINYRRFFTINGLICLNIHDPHVFETYHSYIKQLVYDDVFQGLRIDHIDGLYDPTKYLDDLKALVGDEVYIVVEKILQHNESLPGRWSVEGNTGYDFLSMVNNVLTDTHNADRFRWFYRGMLNDERPIAEHQREKKAHILYNHMGGELENLLLLFLKSDLIDTSSVSREQLKKAIGEVLVECPVYRYYGNALPLEKEEEQALQTIFNNVKQREPDLTQAIDLLQNTLVDQPHFADDEYKAKAIHFYQRLMQFSGPLMAKGVEDTLMYTYNRFIGHNDVGDSPEMFGLTVEQFHEKMLKRQKHWNLSINTTSTHDTKRGEDVRARLNVLTDLGDEWLNTVKHWQQLNADLKQNNAPDLNDEYFIYQTLVGAYPISNDNEVNNAVNEDLATRIDAYLEKAMREAKLHSNWSQPNEAYEAAAKAFARKLLDPSRPFWLSFQQLNKKVTEHGIVNSLSQVLLKFTCPGVPDVYQGCDLWDLSLVDPDNRRPVDYEKRLQILNELHANEQEQADAILKDLWQHRQDARIKLWLTHKLLNLRKANRELFENGFYVSLKVEGRYSENLIAFARRYKHTWLVVAAPLHTVQLCKRQNKQRISEVNWRNTRVVLPPEAPTDWQHLFNTDSKGKAENGILVSEIFQQIPFALLKVEATENERGAGVLVAISSLPSKFGVGDLGPEAYKFADFLSKSKQKYWQILPLNPTEESTGHSPYSSFSSMAGNPILISPEMLAEDGLGAGILSDVSEDTLQELVLYVNGKADYKKAEQVRSKIFDAAYRNFNAGKNKKRQRQFEKFCNDEAYWLNDMTLFITLKLHQGKSWNEWESQFKHRDEKALQQFSDGHKADIDFHKWLQFMFARQWEKLRQHCNALGIQLFGDMPFYVSYDSVDVWANPEIFALDENLEVKGMAGVPPDYFSEDGQLWGMPTYNWDKIIETNYDWWIKRLRKNLELFDLLRIDHFRALQSYWEVPAGEKTARNGEWKAGPREEFFKAVEEKLGKLPFVAEDLGDKMEDVYTLRDKVNLPGMKVLQFAWGENMATSVDAPHNHVKNSIVYTGTHDNNTSIGWYREETNRADHERMHKYLGITVRKRNIHEALCRLAYSSIANTVIIPMQDILGLDASQRMNTPGKGWDNWLWRLQPGQVNDKIAMKLRGWVETFNRY